MLKVGDKVKPIPECIGCHYVFIISTVLKDEFRYYYYLKRETDIISLAYGPEEKQRQEIANVEHSVWRENELQLIGTTITQNIDSINIGWSYQRNEPTPGNPQEIKNESLFNGENLIKSSITIDKINNNGGNDMEILNLYMKRLERKIINKYHEEKEKIIQEDEIQKALIEMQNQINVILENEGRDDKVEMQEPNKELLTTKSKEKINELDIRTDIERDNLHSVLEEIRALFELTEDYAERMKILKKYGIIDKEGKLNV